MKIANDTPKLIINALQNVDVSKLSQSQIQQWYKQGSELLLKYPTNVRPLSAVSMMEINLPGVPQEIGNLLSRINYGSLNTLQRIAAEQITKNWIKKNLPMRK